MNKNKNLTEFSTFTFMQNKKRKEQELPAATSEWGWKYHHTGILTQNEFENERYIPHLKMYVSGFETSPFGIEWMRFDKDSPIHPLVQKMPHVAFEVNHLDNELAQNNFEILTPPNPPMEGVRVAMIVHNGAPVELIEFRED